MGYELRSTANVLHFKVEDALEKFLFDEKINNTDIIEVSFRLYKTEESESNGQD